MASHKNRDEMVIATKYTTGFRTRSGSNEIQSNTMGNGTKSLRVSVDASLKKLQTSYIDILYVHWWDFSTSIPELMISLNQMVTAGKVLYLGISDTPAWIVSKANQYARDHALHPFVIYQGKWSAATRDFERDILPMAQDEGMGIAPWGSLGGGNFKSKAQRETKEGRAMGPASEAQVKVTDVLEKIAKEKDSQITSVALAYVMHKAPYVFPICGGRKIEHLKGNIEALSLELSPEDMKEIEDAVPFDIGFPMNFVGDGRDAFLVKMTGHYDYVDRPKASHPPSEKGIRVQADCDLAHWSYQALKQRCCEKASQTSGSSHKLYQYFFSKQCPPTQLNVPNPDSKLFNTRSKCWNQKNANPIHRSSVSSRPSHLSLSSQTSPS